MAIDYTDPIQTRKLREYLISQGFKSSEIDGEIQKRAISQNPEAYVQAGVKPDALIEAAGGVGTPGGLKVAQYLGTNKEEAGLDIQEQERKFVTGYAAALKARNALIAKDEAGNPIIDPNTGEPKLRGDISGPLATVKSKVKEKIPGGTVDPGTAFRANLSLAQTGLRSALLGAGQTGIEVKSLIDTLTSPWAQEQEIKAKLDELISTVGSTLDPKLVKYAQKLVENTATDQPVSPEDLQTTLEIINRRQKQLGATPGQLPTPTGGLPAVPTDLETEALLSEQPPEDLATIVLNQQTAKKKEAVAPDEETTFARMLREEQLPSPTGIITNLPKSIAGVLGGFVSAIAHPLKTTEAIIGTVAGGVEKLIPGKQRGEPFFDAYMSYLKSRYGNPDRFYTSLVNDPAGTALDIISVIDLGATSVKSIAGATTKAGLSQADDLARYATITQNAIAKADAVDQSLRGASWLFKKAPNEVTFGLPFSRKNLKPEIVQLADELQVDMPASALTESRVVRNVEAVAQNAVFGGKVSEKILKTENRLRELGENLRNEFVKPVDDVLVGETIKTGYTEYIKQFRKLKNELYDSLDDRLKKSVISPDETIRTLQAIIDQKKLVTGGGGNAGYYAKLLKDLKKKVADGSYKIENLLADKSNIGSEIGIAKRGQGVMTGDSGTLGRVEAALHSDLDMVLSQLDPAISAGLKQADAYYADTITRINNRVGKTIKISNPENIVNRVFKPNSQSDIATLKEFMGDNYRPVAETFFQKILAESLSKDGVIDLAKLRRNMNRYGLTTLQEGLGPELANKLTTLTEQAEKLDKLQKAFKKGEIPAIGSRTAFLGNITGLLFAALSNPLLFAKLIGLDIGLANLMGSSWGKKLMTQGYKVKMPDVFNMPSLLQKARPLGRKTRIPYTVNLQLEREQEQGLPATPPPLE